MKVKLINYTSNALELLLFTKQTRLQMSDNTMAEIMKWSDEKKMEELNYMKNTIKSSWEFVDYTFIISDVTRAFTHQLVRHRQASYAQQTQRSVDMTGFNYSTGPSIHEEELSGDLYHKTMEVISDAYKAMIEEEVNPQDARGILPTNIHTNIVPKYNLRALHDMGLVRLCVKTQGEMQNVFRMMRDEVIKVHPWAEGMIKVWCATYGTCCFPTFPTEDCPVKKYVYNPETGYSYEAFGLHPKKLGFINDFHNENRGEAQPIVKKG